MPEFVPPSRAMGFFDLNIPYDQSPSSKTARIKVVVKSMELGYMGIAYNRTMKGVMSERDRCSIAPLSLSSLLSVVPSLSASVDFHRDLLNVPRSSPFRQYTRLTVSVDTNAQSQALHAGNPILKTYDIVAVKPLNQSAFDYACEKAEVDIIAIEFSDKLPFRLKQSMVKAAIKRGVYFEISYSKLIADHQVTRQMISNAKLLVDWTRGKNLIITSAASSVTELRGPYDAANLFSSLLGLSMEQAKSAISKSCRDLITESLKRKSFYKGAVRVELLQFDNKSESVDWLKWDPISSGKGDLQLHDLAKSSTGTATVAKTANSIDFDSIVGTVPSLSEKFLAANKAAQVPVTTTEVSEKPAELACLSETEQASLYIMPFKNQNSGYETSQESHLPSDAPLDVANSVEESTPTNTEEEQLKNVKMLPDESAHGVADVPIDKSVDKINLGDPQMTMSTSPQGSALVIGQQSTMMVEHVMEMGTSDPNDSLVSQCFPESKLKHEDNSTILVGQDEMEVKDVSLVLIQESAEEALMDEHRHADTEMADILVPSNDLKFGSVLPDANREALEVAMEAPEHGDSDPESIKVLDHSLEIYDDSAVLNVPPLEGVSVKEQHHDDADGGSNHRSYSSSLSGKSRGKRKRVRQPVFSPFKRLLNPLPFKKKAKKPKKK